MEQLIIGIDHGYRNMKTAHTCFATAISELESVPDELDGILEYDSKVYTINGKEICAVDVHDKAKSKEYYLLTLAALAKECMSRGVQKGSVRLAVGLPLNMAYADEVFGILKNYKFNLELVPMVFIGGGGAVIKNFGNYQNFEVEFRENIHANAIGYEKLESAAVRRSR